MNAIQEKKQLPKSQLWDRDFVCIFAANLLLNLATNATNSMITSYATYLRAAPMIIGMIAGLYYAVAVVARSFAGPLQMAMDRRRLLIVVFILGGFSFLGYAFAPSMPMFLLFRMLSGVQGSVVSTLTLTIAAASLSKKNMSKGLSYFALTSTIGAAVGPALGLFVRDIGTNLGGEGLGYTFLFVFAALLIFLSLPACCALRPKPVPLEGKERSGKWYYSIAAKAAVFPAFLILLVDMPNALFTSYLIPCAAEKGLPGISAFFLVYAGTLLCTRPLFGGILERWGDSRVYTPFAVIQALSYALVWKADGLPQILLAAVVSAIGYGGVQPIIQALCLQSVPESRRSAASNTYYFGMDLGRMIAPVVFGGFLYPLVGSYGAMFLAAVIPVLLSVPCFLAYGRKQKK